MNECSSYRNVCNELFVDARKMHLTLCMLTLADEAERRLAGQLLEYAVNTYVK